MAHQHRNPQLAPLRVLYVDLRTGQNPMSSALAARMRPCSRAAICWCSEARARWRSGITQAGLSFTPDGADLLTASSGSVLTRWPIASADLLKGRAPTSSREACAAAGRNSRHQSEPADLAGAVRFLSAPAGQRQVRRVQVRHHPPAGEPQVRPERPPRRAGQPRRAPGEPFRGRGVQNDFRHRLQAEPDRPVRELPGRPEQVFFARSRPSGATVPTTSRANVAASADADDGCHCAI
jgi:hypothetical protein